MPITIPWKDLLIVLETTTLLIGITSAYVFKCPDDSQWNLRAKAFCGWKDIYTCLYDISEKQFFETCHGPTVFPEGNRGVFRWNFDIEDCPNHQYQPFIFNSSKQSTCVFIKSKCSEEGQIIFDNGTQKSDISCICNNKNNFRFQTNNGRCIPSQQDCSCYQSDVHAISIQLITTEKMIVINLYSELNSSSSVYDTTKQENYKRILCIPILLLIIILMCLFVFVLCSRRNVSDLSAKDVCPPIPDVKEEEEENQILNIAKLLGLLKYYPEKITSDDIKKELCRSRQLARHTIPWMVLSDICIETYLEKDRKHWCFQGLSLASSDAYLASTNPSDIYLVIFLCCSLSLKRLFISKLSLRGYAIPFIYKNSNDNILASKWALRGINFRQNLKCNQHFLHHKFLIVTFVRIGEQSVSKSKILNDILHCQYHPTFCDRRTIFVGDNRVTSTVEASWCIPDENKTVFSNSFLFLNVRGDVVDCQEEMETLAKCSNLVVILSDVESLNHTANNKLLQKYKIRCANIIYLIVSKTMHGQLRICKKINLRDIQDCRNLINENKAGEQLRIIIAKQTEKSDSMSFIDFLKEFELTDESSSLCNDAKQYASNVVDSCKHNNWRELPNQRNVWLKWLNYFKCYQANMWNKEIDIENKLRSTEKELANLYKQRDNFHEKFLENLFKANRNDKLLLFFWKWMQIFFSGQLEEGEVYSAFQFDRMTFELSRQYEANIFHYFQKNIAKGNRYWYPSIASKLLKMGQSLELMNSGTCLVPIEFIKSVFKELTENVGSGNILTISILGTQDLENRP